MAVVDGGVILAADINAALGLIDPSEVTLPATFTPATGAMADVTGMSITKTVGGTSEVYEVKVSGVATHSASATDSNLQLQLVVDGVTQAGVPQARSSDVNDRRSISWQWPRITGLAAGSRVFKLQANQSAASIWALNGGQVILSVKRVG